MKQLTHPLPRVARQSGISVIELLAGLTIGLIVSVAALSSFSSTRFTSAIHGDSAHVVKKVSRMATSSDELQLLSNDPRSTRSNGLNNLGDEENGKSCKTEALCVAQQRLVNLKTGARTDWREAR